MNATCQGSDHVDNTQSADYGDRNKPPYGMNCDHEIICDCARVHIAELEVTVLTNRGQIEYLRDLVERLTALCIDETIARQSEQLAFLTVELARAKCHYAPVHNCQENDCCPQLADCGVCPPCEARARGEK